MNDSSPPAQTGGIYWLCNLFRYLSAIKNAQNAETLELARGVEPSNRRRVGPETCLAGSCGGGSPPCTLPTKGTHPL